LTAEDGVTELVLVSAVRVADVPIFLAVGLTAFANSLTVVAHVFPAAIVDIGASGFQLSTAEISFQSQDVSASTDLSALLVIFDALSA